MTNEEARNVIEKYLKCRNEPCNDVRLCSECGLNTNESEQDEAFKLAIEALKCMSLNADIIKADAMHKLFITGEMTMEDFKKMCGDVKAIEALSRSEIPNSCHDGDKDINVLCKDVISRQAAIDELMDWVEKEEKKSWSTFKGLFHWAGIKAMIECLPSAQPELIEQSAYIRGFEQGRTQGMIDSQGGKK